MKITISYEDALTEFVIRNYEIINDFLITRKILVWYDKQFSSYSTCFVKEAGIPSPSLNELEEKSQTTVIL